jgi:hypothetical protein
MRNSVCSQSEAIVTFNLKEPGVYLREEKSSTNPHCVVCSARETLLKQEGYRAKYLGFSLLLPFDLIAPTLPEPTQNPEEKKDYLKIVHKSKFP